MYLFTSVFLLNIFALMYSQFKEHIQHFKTKTIFLAISGGVDSMVLSHLLSHYSIKHTLLHCNFQLREQASDLDELFIKNYAKSNNIEVNTINFNTKDYATQHKLTIQEAARNLRYDWFKTFLTDEESVLLTAHHLDDSIETFFINLLRGTGLKGLTGIPNHENQIIRPLLSFTKTQIIDFAKTQNIQFREDSSNESDNYLRNKLRHHIIPEFKNLTQNIDNKMITLFEELKQSNHWIEKSIKNVKTELESNHKISITKLSNYPEFLWHKIFSNFGLSRKQNPELIKLANGKTGAILKIQDYNILKNRTEILVQKSQPDSEIDIKIETKNEILELRRQKFIVSQLKNDIKPNFKNSIAFLDYDKLTFPLQIRDWQKGDKIRPLGMHGNKLISDAFVDKKINKFQKESQLVILSKNQIIWMVDVMISNAFAIDNNTKSILKIEHIKY